MDEGAEFTLGGAGLGTIVVDTTRAPVLIQGTPGTGTALTFRYWLTGKFAPAGDVTLTYLAGSWSFNLGTAPTVSTATLGQFFLTVVFPAPTATFSLVDSSITDGTDAEIRLVKVFDAITGAELTATFVGSAITAGGWTLDVDPTGTVKLATNTYRYRLIVTQTGTVTPSIDVQYAFTTGTWQEQKGTDPAVTVTFDDSVGGPVNVAALKQTLIASTSGPTTIIVSIPSAGDIGVPAGLTLDPDTLTDAAVDFVDADPVLAGIQLAVTNGNWIVTLDETRPVLRSGSGNQFEIPVLVTLPTGASATAVVAPVLLLDGAGYSGAPTGGTATGVAVSRGNQFDAVGKTFIDVAFAPGAGRYLVLGSIGGNEILSIGGFGGAGVSVTSDPLKAVHVGGGVFRFMLAGQFLPGEVLVNYAAGSWNDTAIRGPPEDPGTPANRASTQSFSVVGATADLSIGGATVGRVVLNALGYLEVTFRPTSGNTLEHTTINGDELQLTDAAGATVALGSTPIRVGLSNTYRYSLTTPLSAGRYFVTFVAGRFGDSGGQLNQAETEHFDVALATAELADPAHAQILDRTALESRGWIDVTFNAVATVPVDALSITDADAEISLSSTNGNAIVVDGAAVLVSGTTFRYFFTGFTGGTLSVTFLAGTWTAGGTAVTAADITAGAATKESATDATILSRLYLDVTYRPTPGATVNALTVDGNEFTLSGADAQNLLYDGRSQIDATTFRYLYRGQLGVGKVTATFVAGAWADSAGNTGEAATRQFAVITQAQSFFIELSGGIILQAGDFLSEPLMELKAEVVLEIDTARKIFTLTFNGQLKLIKLGTVGSTVGQVRPRHEQHAQQRAAVLGRRHARDELLGARAVRDLPLRQGHAPDQHDGVHEDRDDHAEGDRRRRLGRHPHVRAPAAQLLARAGRARADPAGRCDERPRPARGRLLPLDRPEQVPALRDRLALVRDRRRPAHLRVGDGPDRDPDRPRARPEPRDRGLAERRLVGRGRAPVGRQPVLGQRQRLDRLQHDPPGRDVHDPGLVPAAAAAGRPDLDHDLRLRARPRRPAEPERSRRRRDLHQGARPGPDLDRRRDHPLRLHLDRGRRRLGWRPPRDRRRGQHADRVPRLLHRHAQPERLRRAPRRASSAGSSSRGARRPASRASS